MRLQHAILAITSQCCQRGCETPSDVEAVVAGRRQQAPEMVRHSQTFPLTVPGRRVWGLLYESLHLGNGLRYALQCALSHWDSLAAGHVGSLSDLEGGRGGISSWSNADGVWEEWATVSFPAARWFLNSFQFLRSQQCCFFDGQRSE